MNPLLIMSQGALFVAVLWAFVSLIMAMYGYERGRKGRSPGFSARSPPR